MNTWSYQCYYPISLSFRQINFFSLNFISNSSFGQPSTTFIFFFDKRTFLLVIIFFIDNVYLMFSFLLSMMSASIQCQRRTSFVRNEKNSEEEDVCACPLEKCSKQINKLRSKMIFIRIESFALVFWGINLCFFFFNLRGKNKMMTEKRIKWSQNLFSFNLWLVEIFFFSTESFLRFCTFVFYLCLLFHLMTKELCLFISISDWRAGNT